MLALFVVMPVEAKKKKYPNGDFYEGKWKKKSPHGLGTMTYANGNVYTGNWEFGQYSGQGKLTYAQTSDTISYEGVWLNGKPNGEGTLILKNGDTYKGHFLEGVYDGKGKATFASGMLYDGDWKNGIISGHGTLVSNNGNKYVGMLIEGVYEGEGTLYEAQTNHVYTGVWENGIFTKGTVKYSDKKSFVGTMGYVAKGKLVDGDEWLEGTWVAKKFTEGVSSATIDGVFYKGTWSDGEFVEGDIKGSSSYLSGSFGTVINGQYEGPCNVIGLGSKHFTSFKGNVTSGMLDGEFLTHDGIMVKGRFKGHIGSNRYAKVDFTGKGSISYNSEKVNYKISGDFHDAKFSKIENSAIVFSGKQYKIGLSGENIKIFDDCMNIKCLNDLKDIHSSILSLDKIFYINLKTPGTLSLNIPGSNLKVVSLTVKGYINNKDLLAINMYLNLKHLDLSKAVMTPLKKEDVIDEEAEARNGFMRLVGFGFLADLDEAVTREDRKKEKELLDFGIPDKCFNFLSDLETIKFPRNIKYIGKGVCEGCIKLREVVLPVNLLSNASPNLNKYVKK